MIDEAPPNPHARTNDNRQGGQIDMRIDTDVAIPTSDGLVLRANIYRPDAAGRFPVVLVHGPYGKDVHFADGFTRQWNRLLELHPGLIDAGSSGRHLRWEAVDPERWVPAGFVCVHIDSRGTGASPGHIDPFCPRETQDHVEAIGWAADAPWSNGRVGLLGISYYAINQWLAAAARPRGLFAFAPWEGGSDHYRDWSRHGGMLSHAFLAGWWDSQILPNQHGNAATHYRDRATGRPNTGPALSPGLLAGNRARYIDELARHTLDDAWHRERSPALEAITAPLLSAGNWGGPGVHLRGNIEGWQRAGSPRKWLSMHAGTHYESFYLPEFIATQQRFLGHFLRDDANGWEHEPPVRLTIRDPRGDFRRAEQAFPPARTVMRDYALGAGLTLAPAAPAAGQISFAADGTGLDFATAPVSQDTEFTGFPGLRLRLASSTTEADIFVALRALDPAGQEWIIEGAHEPSPIARGWLRASHRKTDPARAIAGRPWHTHDEPWPLTPGACVDLDVEIWPTSVVLPAGWRLVLTIAGRDPTVAGAPGRIRHDHAPDRAAASGATITLDLAGCALRLPCIPPG